MHRELHSHSHSVDEIASVAATGLHADFANRGLISFVAIMVLAPLAIFAAQLEVAPQIVLLAGVALACGLVASRWETGALLAASVDWRILGACLAAALALCSLGGETSFFHAQEDWLSRDAVLADLTRNGFPVVYHYKDTDFFLRAPLGMYMIPALAGWWGGLIAAHAALLVQNVALLAVIFYFSVKLVTRNRTRFLLLLICFASVDVVPFSIASLFDGDLAVGEFRLFPLVQMWNAIGATKINYWGHVSNLFWAPNHALSGWLFAVLFLLHWRREIDIAVLALSFVGLLFWSPLSMIGALPFMSLAVVRALSKDSLTLRNAIAVFAALCLLPMAYYLSLDAGAIQREWLYVHDGFWLAYAMILIFGVPQAWIVIASWTRIPDWQRPALAVAILLLLLMPLYRIGVTEGDNDFAMRCAITPLFILAFGFSECAADIMVERKRLYLATVAIVYLSAATALMEVKAAIVGKPHEFSDCNLLSMTAQTKPGYPMFNYLARMSATPGWFLRDPGVRLTAEERVCYPGHRPGAYY
jgi:hypothetical protein